VVSSIGLDTGEFWNNCLAGRSRVEPIPEEWRRYADYQSQLWSPPPAPDYGRCGVTRIEIMQRDPSALLAICASAQALQQAGIAYEAADAKSNSYRLNGLESARCGIFIGSGAGGITTLIANQCNHLSGGRFNPFAVSMVMPNAAAAALSIKFGLHGPARTFCAACASGTVALGHAFLAVGRGELELALGGGSEYLADRIGGVFRGFDAVGALVRDCAAPDQANCPFDRRHSGFLFSGGGAAVLVLEEYEHALRRGAEVVAEIAGFAESSDGRSMMLMDETAAGIKRLLLSLLAESGAAAEDIDYINAHGTGTPSNDAVEARVIAEIFGRRPLVNSTKSLLGHTLGASGAIEAAVTALSIRHSRTHVCRALREPIGDLNFVRTVEESKIRAAISQSFAFGGHNAALLLRDAAASS